MTKTVYSYDPHTGEFICAVELNASDLSPREKGVYLIPGDCLETPPPAHGAGNRPFVVNGQWVLQDLPPEPEPEPEPTLEERREHLKAAVTAERWRRETGGITLAGGVRVSTGIADQSRIAQVIQGMEANGYEDVPFKAESGWLTLTLEQMKAMLKAIAAHVRACFEAERAHHEAIDVLDEAGIETYAVSAGWPGEQA